MKTITSLYLIAEQTRVDLAALAERDNNSINNLIIEAINGYLSDKNRMDPMDPPKAGRQFSVRMPEYMKSGIIQVSAEYQAKFLRRVSGNMILNTALVVYLKNRNASTDQARNADSNNDSV